MLCGIKEEVKGAFDTYKQVESFPVENMLVSVNY